MHVAIPMQDFFKSETTPKQGHQRKEWGATREDRKNKPKTVSICGGRPPDHRILADRKTTKEGSRKYSVGITKSHVSLVQTGLLESNCSIQIDRREIP